MWPPLSWLASELPQFQQRHDDFMELIGIFGDASSLQYLLVRTPRGKIGYELDECMPGEREQDLQQREAEGGMEGPRPCFHFLQQLLLRIKRTSLRNEVVPST